MDVLLGACRGNAGRQSKDAARERLGLLEGSDPARSGKSASGYSTVCLTDRRDAFWTCNGAAEAGGNFFRGAATVGESGGTVAVCEFGSERVLDFRRGAISGSAGGGESAGEGRREVVAWRSAVEVRSALISLLRQTRRWCRP